MVEDLLSGGVKELSLRRGGNYWRHRLRDKRSLFCHTIDGLFVPPVKEIGLTDQALEQLLVNDVWPDDVRAANSLDEILERWEQAAEGYGKIKQKGFKQPRPIGSHWDLASSDD